ncbi:MAG: hypothetical protein WEB60_05505 [Terrimicrobiaceae bacterium]
MIALTRIEILIDAAHRQAMESRLTELGISKFIVLQNVSTGGFEKSLHNEGFVDLLGTSLILAYCEESTVESAKDPLRAFLKQCGGALFVSPVQSLNF